MKKLISLVGKIFPDVDPSTGKPLGIGSSQMWDSLGHFNLLLAIEEEFDIRFSPEEIAELKTLAQIEKCLKNKGVEV